MINLHAKFDVSMFTHYKDTKNDAKCKNSGGLGGYGLPEVISNMNIQYSAYNILFNLNRNYASIFYRFQVIASHLSKVTNFNITHLHLVPPFGLTSFEFCQDLWHQKLEPLGVVCVILHFAI